jgi:hypothetical protein
VVVSMAAFHYKEMAVAVTRSIIRHPTNTHLSNNRVVPITATITKILSLFLLLVGSRLHQARMTLRVDLPHLHLGLMDLMGENRFKGPRATLNHPLVATTRNLDVDPQDMVSRMIVDDQGIHIEEKVEIHTEDSGTRIADSIGAIKKLDPANTWALLGKQTL